MQSERVDPIDKDYKPIEFLDMIASNLFWLLTVLSLFTIYSKSILPTSYYDVVNNIVTSFYISLVALNNLIFILNRFFYFPRAEQRRRKELLSNSFDIRLELTKSNLYYNNSLVPSIAKLGLNLFENTLYGKTICLKMAEAERPRVIGYLVIWLVSATWRFTDLQLIVFLFQLLFSTQVLVRYISIEYVRAKFEIMFDQLHKLFLDSNKCTRKDNYFNVIILATFADYESVKAGALFKQSTKLFKKYNPSLSTEWESIKHELELTPIN